jgi:hypothetical protein
MKAIVNSKKQKLSMNGRTFEIDRFIWDENHKKISLWHTDKERFNSISTSFNIDEIIIVNIDEELKKAKESDLDTYIKLIEYCMANDVWLGNALFK